MTAHNVTIGLLWHSMNSDNLGVGALTLGNIAILEQAAALAGVKPHFIVIGWEDPRPPYFSRQDIEVIGLRARDLNPVGGRLAKIAARCDVVLDIGAGDSFSDIYGPGRISKMLLASSVVLNAGTSLIMCPQTIGPFGNPIIARAARNILRRADMVCTRDRLSSDFARTLGVDGDIIDASDVALRLPFIQAEKKERPQVGINVSGLLYNGGYDKNNMFGLQVNYAALIERVIRYFVTETSSDVHLVGHVISDTQPIEDDYRAAHEIAAKFDGVVVAPKFHSPTEAKSYISGMDFFIGARMHACIAALSAGVAVLPMAYSRKFEGLFGALGYDAIADCKQECESDILTKVKRAFSDRENLSARAAVAASLGNERLAPYEAALTDVFSTLSLRAA